MWSCSGVSFENKPFEVVRKETRECQFGPHYFKKRERTSSQIYLQGTRKLGCHAHIDICEYRLYPEYALSATETKCLKSKQLRQLRESKLLALKQALEEGKPVDVVTKFFFFFLPTHESHEKSHPTGIESGPTSPHFKENWRLGTRRLNWSKWSSQSTERVCKESMLCLKTVSHWPSILPYYCWHP